MSKINQRLEQMGLWLPRKKEDRVKPDEEMLQIALGFDKKKLALLREVKKRRLTNSQRAKLRRKNKVERQTRKANRSHRIKARQKRQWRRRIEKVR